MLLNRCLFWALYESKFHTWPDFPGFSGQKSPKKQFWPNFTCADCRLLSDHLNLPRWTICMAITEMAVIHNAKIASKFTEFIILNFYLWIPNLPTAPICAPPLRCHKIRLQMPEIWENLWVFELILMVWPDLAIDLEFLIWLKWTKFTFLKNLA